MGHIAEPKGVDFIIQSPPLTDKERKELSEFIEKKKRKQEKNSFRKENPNQKKKPAANRVARPEPNGSG